jgi:nucleotide-binding universal stress UspA family protein
MTASPGSTRRGEVWAEARARQASVYAVCASASQRADRFQLRQARPVERITRAAPVTVDVLVQALGRVRPDVEVRVIAVDEPAGPALVSIADREDDLLVVGDAQGRGCHWLRTGSVAQHCVRRARCLLLVVPAPKLAKVRGEDVVRRAAPGGPPALD